MKISGLVVTGIPIAMIIAPVIILPADAFLQHNILNKDSGLTTTYSCQLWLVKHKY
jgi:hypothetical protein